MAAEKALVTVNGVHYRWPNKPVAVACIDGGDPAYLHRFLADGSIPDIARFMKRGFSVVADGTEAEHDLMKAGAATLKSYQIFEYAINGTAHGW